MINHAGMMVGETGREEWRTGMRALAAIPHVSVKISGIGFAFRLVRNLATELGGRFVIAPGLFTLLLPAVEDGVTGHATGGAT